jgi:hypothetical protein
MTEGKRYKTRQKGIRITVPGRKAVSFDFNGLWPSPSEPPCTDEYIQKFLEGHPWYGNLFIDEAWRPEPKTIERQVPQINMALNAISKIPGLVPGKMPEKPKLPTLREVHFMKRLGLIKLAEERKLDVDTSLPYRILKEEVKSWLKSQEE